MRLGLGAAFVATTLSLSGCGPSRLSEPRHNDRVHLFYESVDGLGSPKIAIVADKFSDPFTNLTKEKVDSGQYDVIQLIPADALIRNAPLSIVIGGDFKFVPNSVKKKHFNDHDQVNIGLNFKVTAYGKIIDVFVSPTNCPVTIYDQNDPKNLDGMKYVFHLSKNSI